MALSSGTLRAITAASRPSARIQLAPGFTPTSRRMVDSMTPVHSLVLSSPSSCWAVIVVGMRDRL